MRWGCSEAVALQVRDLSIECVALTSDSAGDVQLSCSEEYFRRYRAAAAQLAGVFVDFYSRAVFDFPHLAPDDAEWKRIAIARIGAGADRSYAPTTADALRAMLVRVTARAEEIRALAPRLHSASDELPRRLDDVAHVLHEWTSMH